MALIFSSARQRTPEYWRISRTITQSAEKSAHLRHMVCWLYRLILSCYNFGVDHIFEFFRQSGFTDTVFTNDSNYHFRFSFQNERLDDKPLLNHKVHFTPRLKQSKSPETRMVSGLLLELLIRFERTTCSLRVSCSTCWATAAYLLHDGLLK